MKKRVELLDYKKISGKIYAICFLAVSASVRGELLYILAADSNGPLLSSLCYGIYGICAICNYMIFNRYEGRIFLKFRLYSMLSLLLSISVVLALLVFPGVFEGYGMTKFGSSISAFSAVTVFASAFIAIPSYEFFQLENLKK